jgi:hypothetical protein
VDLLARRRRLRAALLLIAALAVGVVLVLRAAALVADPSAPTAPREQRFLGWAWRFPEAPALLAQVRDELAPGEPVLLLLPRIQRRHAGWWQVMAVYHLPGHRLLGVETGPRPDLPDGRYAIAHLSRRHQVTVSRHAPQTPARRRSSRGPQEPPLTTGDGALP